MIQRILFLVLFPGLFLSFNDTKSHGESLPFYEGLVHTKLYMANKENNTDIFLTTDTLQNPLFYYSDIFSEVCTDHVCKPAELRLFWDVCGNFLGFKIPSKTPLTKANHLNFTKYDYYTLYIILNNPKAPISRIGKSELVNYNTVGDVDGLSGATLTGADHMVVEGAAYSTHTLWHLVHDSQDLFPRRTAKEHPKEYWAANCRNKQTLTTEELTLFLFEAEKNKMLHKYAIQRLLVDDINELSAINALLINNYLQRQPGLSPEIEKSLSMCKSVQGTFTRMLP